eukprot:3878923-Rhodomonas_salina.1
MVLRASGANIGYDASSKGTRPLATPVCAPPALPQLPHHLQNKHILRTKEMHFSVHFVPGISFVVVDLARYAVPGADAASVWCYALAMRCPAPT